jgi:glyoxylase-like metal-dependent hydrolase (beta-lactamase superfamily II)
MTYHGHVEPGGDAQVRELAAIMITKVSVGPMDNNTYLLRDRATGGQLLIDAAAEPRRILELVGADGLDAIVTTHAHADHFGALADVGAATAAPLLASAQDAAGIEPPPTRLIGHGDTVRFGGSSVSVIALRGHTPGAVALLYDDPTGPPHLFTGDCLFPGGVGKTWSGDDFLQLIDDVEQRLFDVLPDETWVYPGHGDDTTLGRERPQLAQWRRRGW